MCSALSSGTGRIKICNCRTEVKIFVCEPNPAEQMEAMYAAGACWHSEQRPKPHLLRPRIDHLKCLQQCRRSTCGHLGHTTGGLHEIMMEVVVHARWTSWQKPVQD